MHPAVIDDLETSGVTPAPEVLERVTKALADAGVKIAAVELPWHSDPSPFGIDLAKLAAAERLVFGRDPAAYRTRPWPA